MALIDVLTTKPEGSTIIIIVVAVVFLLLWNFFALRLDPQEPPPLKPTIPVIGHIVDMLRYHHKLYRILYHKNRMPICTLPMLGGKMYVVNSPDLVQAAFRTRNLSFEPYVTQFIARMTQSSAKAMTIFTSEEFHDKWMVLIQTRLSGDHMKRLNVLALAQSTQSLNELPRSGATQKPMWTWLKELMGLATTTALFGSHNPWKADPSLTETYWTYEGELMRILLNVLPSVSARKGHQARAKMSRALYKYFEAKHHLDSDVAALTRDTVEQAIEYGMTTSDIAALELAVIHGALSNTVPTTFWFLMQIFSDPPLLAKLRQELSAVGIISQPDQDSIVTIDSSLLDDSHCPLLLSAFRESQRYFSSGTINRRVLEDTVLSDGTHSYLLKKGNNLVVSSGVLHTLDAWGRSPTEFDAERFVRGDKEGQNRQRRRAFIPFGGGHELCPGRNFASAEILGTAVVVILGFDISALDGGPVEMPGKIAPVMSQGLPRPVPGPGLTASVRRRKGWEDVTWRVAGS